MLNLSLTKNKTTVCHTILLPCIEIKLDKHVELNIYTGKYCLRSNIKGATHLTRFFPELPKPEIHQNSVDSCCQSWDTDQVCVLRVFLTGQSRYCVFAQRLDGARSVHSQVQVKTRPQASPATRVAWLLSQTPSPLVLPYLFNTMKYSS